MIGIVLRYFKNWIWRYLYNTFNNTFKFMYLNTKKIIKHWCSFCNFSNSVQIQFGWQRMQPAIRRCLSMVIIIPENDSMNMSIIPHFPVVLTLNLFKNILLSSRVTFSNLSETYICIYIYMQIATTNNREAIVLK